jgi:MATE family multidrug resistance protein
VAATAVTFLPWVVLLPVVGVSSYIYDGVFIGATWTRALLITMAAAFAVFALLLLVTGPLGNHGLWLAFTLFFVARAAGQAAMLPRLRAKAFG